jgi:VanZ family protein
MRRNVFLLASLAFIVVLTLGPTGGDDVVEISELGDVVNAVGRSDTSYLLHFSLEAAANVLLFMPLGAALYMRGLSIGRTALYGFVLSAAVEGAQLLLIPGRTTSLDDVLLNTLGAVLGQGLLSRSTRDREPGHEDHPPM